MPDIIIIDNTPAIIIKEIYSKISPPNVYYEIFKNGNIEHFAKIYSKENIYPSIFIRLSKEEFYSVD